jgi:hypothetical protein
LPEKLEAQETCPDNDMDAVLKAVPRIAG